MDHCGSLWDRCGPLWIVLGRGSLWDIVVDRCGSLWIVVDRCGSLWVVPGFRIFRIVEHLKNSIIAHF